MNNYYTNLNEINKLKKSFIIGDESFKGNNKTYYDLKYDNKFLYINLKGNIYNLELIPRNKIFIQVDSDTINNYKKLIKMISKHIKINIQEHEFIYSRIYSWI